MLAALHSMCIKGSCSNYQPHMGQAHRNLGTQLQGITHLCSLETVTTAKMEMFFPTEKLCDVTTCFVIVKLESNLHTVSSFCLLFLPEAIKGYLCYKIIFLQ